MAAEDKRDPYLVALDNLRVKVDELHRVMHDGFKAPEQTIALLSSVEGAMWEAQVQYAAMMRKSD